MHSIEFSANDDFSRDGVRDAGASPSMEGNGWRAQRAAHHIRHWADGGATNIENLTLLCTHHHTLLHEGGFGIRRTDDGALRFVRGDGRYIPPCGYRAEDMRDEYPRVEQLSMEGSAAQVSTAHSTSMEVREPSGHYVVTPWLHGALNGRRHPSSGWSITG